MDYADICHDFTILGSTLCLFDRRSGGRLCLSVPTPIRERLLFSATASAAALRPDREPFVVCSSARPVVVTAPPPMRSIDPFFGKAADEPGNMRRQPPRGPLSGPPQALHHRQTCQRQPEMRPDAAPWSEDRCASENPPGLPATRTLT
jgi:hypothetical protein